MIRDLVCHIAVLAGLLAAVGEVSAAVVIPVEASPLPETSADMPLTLALDVAPEPRPRPANLALGSLYGFELGQIATTPDDLRHRSDESYRPVLLSLLVAATLPLGLLGHSWWVEAQMAARRD